MKFKNIHKSFFGGLILTKRGERQIAEKIYRAYGVPLGTSRALYEDTQTYQPYEREITLLNKHPDQLDRVFEWLDGAGELSFDGELGFYKARVISVKPEKLNCDWTLITVQLEVQPFFWLFSGREVVTFTSSGSILNLGTKPSKPIIKIFGSGNITLTINGVNYQLTGVESYITIDSERPEVYKDNLKQGRKLVGGFPTLSVGRNEISWSGNVTRVEVIGNWIMP